MTKSFLWGAATAGHQTEGNNFNADVWLLEQVPNTTFVEPSGDACDSLNRWREDLRLLKAVGLNTYRFSVEWSRIEPAEGQFSQAWLDHYARIAATCRDQNMSPVLTLSHFTSPRWFAAAGGWANPNAPRLFARFARNVARSLGPFATHIVTFNEPNLPLMGKWTSTPIADPAQVKLDAMQVRAARLSGSSQFNVWVYSRGENLKALLAGHRLAREEWKAEHPSALLGMSLAVPDTQGVGSDAGVTAYRESAEKPFFAAAIDDDFVGVQTYGRLLMDSSRVVAPPVNSERTQSGDEFYPSAIGAAVTHVHRATGKPIFVTENGIATSDDAQRARYITQALASLSEARHSGVPVIGYLHWSLLDNFEWRRGYGQKFGLASVNRATFERSLKPSAKVFADLVRDAA